MSRSDMNRRDFTKLAAAALGGVAAGSTVVGRVLAEEDDDKPKKNPLLEEPHVCRGLNTCKEKGGCGATKGKNACAGQGNCATVEKHVCRGENACKGQGGCGEHPGENACKTKGSCEVPLKDKAWKAARKNFEAAMKKAGKKVGPAPKPKKS